MASLVYKIKCKDCGHVFTSMSSDPNQVCPKCGSRNTQSIDRGKKIPWKIIFGLIIIMILIIAYLIEEEPPLPPPPETKYSINLKKVINDNFVKISFKNIDNQVIPWDPTFENKIKFSVENLDNTNKQIIDVNNGIIAPCFKENDTVNVKLRWDIVSAYVKDFTNSTSLKKSKNITFIRKENQKNHRIADCFIIPEIIKVTQNKKDCSINIIFSDEIEKEFQENQNILVSINGENGDFKHKKIWEWNPKYENEKKNIWAYIKGKKEQTLHKFKWNGDSYVELCKPRDKSKDPIIKAEMKKKIKNFLINPDSSLNELMNFCSKHVIKKAKVQISNGQCKLNGDFSINSFVSNIMINQSDQNCLKNSSISVAMNEKGKITKINIK